MPGLPGRNQVAFDDINYDAVTLPIDNVVGSIVYDGTSTNVNGIPVLATGRAVTLVNSGGRVCAALAQDGDAVIGRLIRITADGFCTVVHRGFIPLGAGLAATVSPGRRCVGAVGGLGGTLRGYIREILAATAAEQARGRALIWDNNDLNNVVVDLG